MVIKTESDTIVRTKEFSQSLVLLALTGSSVGGLLGMVALATRALGR